MNEIQIKEWLKESREILSDLEEEGDNRDWQIYDEVSLEVEILEAVLK